MERKETLEAANTMVKRLESITKSMDHELADFFFRETSKAFDFVVTEHCFAAPRLWIDEHINFAFVTFMGKNLAIECILDQREGVIDSKVARVIAGQKTTEYAVDESGFRMREGLASLFRRRGVRERLFRPVGDLELRERITVTLCDFASMLKKHGQEILNDSAEILT